MSNVFEIPKSVAEALAQTAEEVEPLFKGSENHFQNYKYVSIDDYYLQVPKHALRHGLTWTLREVDTGTFRMVGKKGEETAMRFTYAVDLVHVEGHYVKEYDRITVYHPAQGAQTSGSARSYADKMFMRSAFKIATGEVELREPDADATDSRKMNADVSIEDDWPDIDDLPEEKAKPEPKEEPVADDFDPTEALIEREEPGLGPVFKKPGTSDDASLIAEVFRQFAPTQPDVETLRRFWGVNKDALDVLKELDSKLYEALHAEMKSLAKTLPTKEKKK